MPTLDALFAALATLRAAEDPSDPRLAAPWRVVDEHVRTTWPGGGPDGDERRQETMLAIARSVSRMEAQHPLQAAKWISRIHRNKRVDAVRAARGDIVARSLDRGEDAAIDRVAASEPRAVRADAIERVIELVEIEVAAMLAERQSSAVRRQHERMQARAALRRHVLREDADELAAALGAAEPIGRDRLYKWVERGRPIVLDALARWAARAADAPAELEIVRALREIVEERRADAGQPRPGRRRGGVPP